MVIAKLFLASILLVNATHGFGINVSVEQILEAPTGPYGRVFSISDELEYLPNGSLVYMGAYPPKIYVVDGAKFLSLIERYRNPIYETGDPRVIVTELLSSRIPNEVLYYASIRGAEQENYRVISQTDGSVLVETVSREYLDGNLDRRTPRDFSLRDGYYLDPQESETVTGGLNPAVRDVDSRVDFLLDKAFPVAFVEHGLQIAVSPDKRHIAMIVNYRAKESGRATHRLVVFRLDYDTSKAREGAGKPIE